MLKAKETTKWDYPNHIYYLSEDKRKLFGYEKAGTTEPVWFKSPLRFDPRHRSFTSLEKGLEPL